MLPSTRQIRQAWLQQATPSRNRRTDRGQLPLLVPNQNRASVLIGQPGRRAAWVGVAEAATAPLRAEAQCSAPMDLAQPPLARAAGWVGQAPEYCLALALPPGLAWLLARVRDRPMVLEQAWTSAPGLAYRLQSVAAPQEPGRYHPPDLVPGWEWGWNCRPAAKCILAVIAAVRMPRWTPVQRRAQPKAVRSIYEGALRS